MRLEVLGACGTFPSAGGACSGYLLAHDGYSMWVDAGSGTMGRLLDRVDVDKVNAVYLTHQHPDHFVDIYPMFYALSFHPTRPSGIPIFAPEGTAGFVGQLLSEDAKDAFEKVFTWHTLKAGDTTEAGPFRMRIFDAAHSAENLTLRVEANGKVFCYSGDTGPNPGLAHAARDADLLLCEASWQRDTEVPFDPIHLRAHEAGEVAHAAGVKRLMLTHIWPVLDLSRSLEQAADAYDGPIELAIKSGGADL